MTKEIQVRDRIPRYLVFFIGVCFVAMGITLTSKTSLGTSPISAIPYNLSLAFTNLTLGNWTIMFNVLMVLIQWAILKKEAKLYDMVCQILLALALGYLVDFFVFITPFVHPATYPGRIVLMIIGIIVNSIGVFLQLMANVIMLPGDSMCRVVAGVTNKKFGTMRFILDVAMVCIAALICVLSFHDLRGVREGTILAALLTGNIVKLYTKYFAKLFDGMK